MNRMLLGLALAFANLEPRFNLCVNGVGFLAPPLTPPAPRASRFVPFEIERTFKLGGSR